MTASVTVAGDQSEGLVSRAMGRRYPHHRPLAVAVLHALLFWAIIHGLAGGPLPAVDAPTTPALQPSPCA